MMVGLCSDEVDGNHDLHVFKCGEELGTNYVGDARYIIMGQPLLPSLFHFNFLFNVCHNALFSPLKIPMGAILMETNNTMKPEKNCWAKSPVPQPQDQQGFGACHLR